MKKKLLAVLLVGVLGAFTLTACGGSAEVKSETKVSTGEEAEEEAEEEEAEAEEEEADAEEEAVDEEAEAVEEAAEEEETETEEAADTSVWDAFDTFYAGITDDDNTYMLLAFGQDGSIGCAMFVDVESAESGSWVGDVTSYEDQPEMLTISDEDNGTSLTFSVEEQGEGYLLDMGDVGAAAVGPITKEEFASAAQAVEEGATPQF
ncbi:MAG: hypothetical protein K6F99_02185 [Lachnospiraceae bacterium]|nr:hypothetical protein [Lachnospiraceae bacterium]